MSTSLFDAARISLSNRDLLTNEEFEADMKVIKAEADRLCREVEYPSVLWYRLNHVRACCEVALDDLYTEMTTDRSLISQIRECLRKGRRDAYLKWASEL